MDWSEKDLCIKCNKGGNLLVCSENGCPLAVHEGCMGCPARFDDAGHFYCPYCLYKQAVAESRRAREYALARKKALLIFMDEEMMGSEKHIEENKRAERNGRSESKIGKGNVKNITCNDGKSKSNSDDILDQPIQLDEEHKISNAEEGKIQEEESGASAGSKGQDPSCKLHEEKSISNEEEKNNQEEEHDTSAASSGQDPSLKLHEEQNISNEEGKKNQEEDHDASAASSGQDPSLKVYEEQNISNEEGKKNHEEEHDTSAASSGQDPSLKTHEHKSSDEEEEKIGEEECQTSSASTGEDASLTLHARAKRGSKRSKPVDRDSESVSVRSKLRKKLDKNKQTSPTVNSPRRSSRSSSSALKTKKVSNEVVGASKKSKQPEQPSAKRASDAFGSGKRKRLYWSEKEEETLKAGVEKFSKEANKNIPWRKILDLGHHVFDATRTPGDLKDKWRNMSAK